MFLLNKWNLKVTEKDEATWLVAKVRPEHYFDYDVIHIEFNEIHQLFVTPSVLCPKQITKQCHEHQVYVIMHVVECVDKIFNLR